MTTPLKAVAAGGNSAELREWGAGDFLPVALGGTGGTTAAAARSNLGLGSAAVASIVGTVSQSGGVPTGAILQRGSNANGEFVRFADGTQICWRASVTTAISGAAGSVFVNGAALGPYSWPAAFSSIPREIYIGHKYDGAANHCWAAAASKGSTSQSGTFQLFRASASSENFYVEMIAIGRWFE